MMKILKHKDKYHILVEDIGKGEDIPFITVHTQAEDTLAIYYLLSEKLQSVYSSEEFEKFYAENLDKIIIQEVK